MPGLAEESAYKSEVGPSRRVNVRVLFGSSGIKHSSSEETLSITVAGDGSDSIYGVKEKIVVRESAVRSRFAFD